MTAASGAWSQAECDPGNHEPWGRGALARRDGRAGGAASWHRGMSAQPSEHDNHDVIRLGGETAVVVPVHEYHVAALAVGTFRTFKPVNPGWAGGTRTHDRRIMRSTAPCATCASCADDTNHCTDGTHRAGIIWRAGPRTDPRSRRLCLLILLLCVTSPRASRPTSAGPPGRSRSGWGTRNATGPGAGRAPTCRAPGTIGRQ
jgi:hypothetical protein